MSDQWKPWIELQNGLFYRVVISVITDLELYEGLLSAKYGKLISLCLTVAKWHPSNKQRGKGPSAFCFYHFHHPVSYNCSTCILRTEKNNDKKYKQLMKEYAKEYRKVFGSEKDR